MLSSSEEFSFLLAEQSDSISDPLTVACTALAVRLSASSSGHLADGLLRRAIQLSAELRTCLDYLTSSRTPDLRTQYLSTRTRQFMTLTLGLWLRSDVLPWIQSLNLNEPCKPATICIAAYEREWDDSSYMLPGETPNDGPNELRSSGRENKDNRPQRRYRFQLLVVNLVAGFSLLALAVFLVFCAQRWDVTSWWRSRPLGGHLTLGQAKAVDFITGALFAPLIIAALTPLWFSSARSSISVNQGDKQQGVSLHALVEASCTSRGSYNPIKLKNLFGSGRIPFICLGILTLVVAIAGSLISNVIAYEAYSRHQVPGTFTLTSLSDDAINGSPHGWSFQLRDGDVYDYNSNQTASFAEQLSGYLTEMTLKNTALTEGPAAAYTGINATRDSLTLDASIRNLYNVAAYRITTECNALAPTTLMIEMMGDYIVQFTPLFDTGPLYQGQYPGTISSLQTAMNDDYAYAAFTLPGIKSYVFLGYLASFNESSKPVNSSYGTVYPQAYNMTSYGFSETKDIMSTWGLNCTLLRQRGTANLTREGSSLDWTIVASSFDAEQESVPLFMSHWQLALSWTAPGASCPGLAPAMAFTLGGLNDIDMGLDFFANNFLQASAEIERMVYEVAAWNTTRAKNFPVQGSMDAQFYRIAYVPALVLASLLAIFVAASLTAGLAWYSEHHLNAPRGRKIDGLRLLSDLMLGLQDQPYDPPKASWTSKAIERWGKNFRVHYMPWTEDSKSTIRLDRLDRTQTYDPIRWP